jgi:IS1 transposase
VSRWKCYFYVTDGWPVYPMFIPDGDQIVSKTYLTRVEGENTRLRHYLARLKRKTLCYSKSTQMLKHSIRLLIHYLKFDRVPIPASVDSYDRIRRVPLDRQIIPQSSNARYSSKGKQISSPSRTRIPQRTSRPSSINVSTSTSSA